MKPEQVEFVLNRFAAQLDELQIETAALGTAVRALMDVCEDKEAFKTRFRQVMANSGARLMTVEQLQAHEARHEALLQRL
ncbi:MAG: hypothetical protein EON54_03805 [Alcaligenaceae bacterium]|nr:MAG: hypothetical protein EON54_03805 [Alcaligenaceae bacterium]